jgi:purine-binding chemotaxis protein CheW
MKGTVSNIMLNEPDYQNLPDSSGEMYGKYLTFWTDDQLFGIPIADVEQIVGIQKITPIPEFPEYAKGIINLRGSIIAVIDIRLRLHKQEVPYNERTCIIIVNIQQNLIGLIVDAVDEVTKIADENISDPPKMATDVTNDYLTGIAKTEEKVVLLLYPDKILRNEEISEIAQH